MKQFKNIIITIILMAGLSGYTGETQNGVNLNGVKLNGIALNGVNLNGIRLNGFDCNGTGWKSALSKMATKPLVKVQPKMDKEDEDG